MKSAKFKKVVAEMMTRKYRLKNVGVRGQFTVTGIEGDKFWVTVVSHGHFKTALWSAETIVAHAGKEIIE